MQSWNNAFSFSFQIRFWLRNPIPTERGNRNILTYGELKSGTVIVMH